MGIEILFDIAGDMTADQKAAAENGALDPDQVHFQYLCTTEDGGHNPEGEPDSHVRPEHAALHGTVWHVNDPFAPVPPLDYGCRCAMRHVGKPDSFAARVLQAESGAMPSTRAAHYAKWLDDHVEGWEDIAAAVAKVKAEDRAALALEMVKEAKISQPQSVALMIIETLPPDKPPQKAQGQ